MPDETGASYILRYVLQAKPRFLLRLLLVGYALVLSVEGGANVWINFIGKGCTWDLYPLAEAFWVACSVVVVIVLARRPSMKRLAAVVIVLMFLDSFVDLCAAGHESWWAGPGRAGPVEMGCAAGTGRDVSLPLCLLGGDVGNAGAAALLRDGVGVVRRGRGDGSG
jgi:hypothetical protein